MKIMLKKLYEKIKNILIKFKKLLIFLGSLGIITFFITISINWWNRPIIQVHISEFYPSTEIKKLTLGKQIENLDFFVNALKSYGALNIKIQNIGRTPAQNISFNLLPTHCKLGEPHIWKTNADCEIKISLSTDLRMTFPEGTFVNISPEDIEPQNRGYYINVPELRKNSEIELKYTIYKESDDEPMFKFSKILCDNAKVKIFYYHQ